MPSKAGVIGLTQSAARELGPVGQFRLGACGKSEEGSVFSPLWSQQTLTFPQTRDPLQQCPPGFIRTPMTQKVPQKVLDKVGDCGWRAE